MSIILTILLFVLTIFFLLGSLLLFGIILKFFMDYKSKREAKKQVEKIVKTTRERRNGGKKD